MAVAGAFPLGPDGGARPANPFTYPFVTTGEAGGGRLNPFTRLRGPVGGATPNPPPLLLDAVGCW